MVVLKRRLITIGPKDNVFRNFFGGGMFVGVMIAKVQKKTEKGRWKRRPTARMVVGNNGRKQKRSNKQPAK